MIIPDWFAQTISEELARLYALNLEGCPAADVLETTTRSWVDDLFEHLKHSQLDARVDRPRIRTAFRKIRLSNKRWPAPRTFLEYLPERPQQKRLTRFVECTPEELQRRMVRAEQDRAALGLRPLAEVLAQEGGHAAR